MRRKKIINITAKAIACAIVFPAIAAAAVLVGVVKIVQPVCDWLDRKTGRGYAK